MSKKRYQYVIVPKMKADALLAKPDVIKAFPWTIVMTDHIGFPVAFDLGELSLMKSLKVAYKLGKMQGESYLLKSLELKRAEIKPTV